LKFYDRDSELKYLDKVFKASKKRSQMLVLFGRRRIGKTSLIEEFLKKRKGINFFVEVKDEKLLLEELESAISVINPKVTPVFKDFDDFFEYLFNYLGKQKDPFIFAFDEIQNFNRTVPGFYSIMQKHWDKYSNDSRLMMICVGSYIGMMKRIFTDAKEPLFGRAEHTINLKKFGFKDTVDILLDKGVKDPIRIIELYGTMDGIPKYLRYMDIFWKGNLWNFINDLFYEDIAPLREEGKNVLVQEFGSVNAAYFSILEAIARGKCVPKEIADKTGININTVNKYLHDLTTYYGITERRYPITEDPFKSRNVRYFLKDNFYRFWFRFVYSHSGDLEGLKKEFDNYLSGIFEDICIEKIKIDFKFKEVGKWWTRTFEVDILAIDKNSALIGECKWSNKKMDLGDFFKLKDKSENLPLKDAMFRYALFSKNGFTERLKNMAPEEDISLYDLEKICFTKKDEVN
jgi:AAA+ ATPase superfamily predicted ATPase